MAGALLADGLGAAAATARRWRRDGAVVGSVLAVADANGHVAMAVDGGTADGTDLHEGSRFLLTSITKAVTAVQVLRLAEEGLVDLRAPVATYVPEFVGDGKEGVQVWHLLAHCSGMSLRGNVAEGPPTALTAEELRRFAIDIPLARPPGGASEYCSPGVWVLAALIERVAGVGHVAHLAQLLEPLGLGGMAYAPDEPPADYVPPQVHRNSHLAERVRRIAYPAGGLVATAEEVARFGAAVAASREGTPTALLSPAMLGAASREWSRGAWPDGRPQIWGLGWELAGPGDGWSPRTLFHFGASGTGLWVDVDRGVAFALLTATWYLPRQRYGEIANAFTASLTRAS